MGMNHTTTSDAAQQPQLWPLDQAMLQITADDVLSIRDLCEGVFVIGNTGSGKSSTTGTMIPMAALRDGWGVVAYTTKPEDAAFWERLCDQAGRRDHLLIVRPDGKTHFNLMRYEMERLTTGAGNTVVLANLLSEIFREGKQIATPTEASEYFQSLSEICLCSAIDILRLAKEPLNLDAINRLIDAAPMHRNDLDDPKWQARFCFQTILRADANAKTEAEKRTCRIATEYFLGTLPNMNDRSRGDVISTIQAGLFQLNRDPVRNLLDSPEGCSFMPEWLERGLVLVVDCSPAVYGTVGRMLTIAFKRIVKQMLRRRVIEGEWTRPVLNFADEAQTYVTRDDADFQQVCRSNRVATVFLTQSFDNFEAALGSEAHTNSLANALTTHFYHATSGKTAEWIERRIASDWDDTESVQMPGRNPDGHAGSPSMSFNEGMYPRIPASELTGLRTGGPLNDGLVDAIVFKPGRRFKSSGAPFVRVTFRQG